MCRRYYLQTWPHILCNILINHRSNAKWRIVLASFKKKSKYIYNNLRYQNSLVSKPVKLDYILDCNFYFNMRLIRLKATISVSISITHMRHPKNCCVVTKKGKVQKCNTCGTNWFQTPFNLRHFQILCSLELIFRLKGISRLQHRPIEPLSVRVVINGVDSYLSPARCDRSRDQIYLAVCHE